MKTAKKEVYIIQIQSLQAPYQSLKILPSVEANHTYGTPANLDHTAILNTSIKGENIHIDNNFHNSSPKLAIHKKATPHTLRHCFVTHLLGGGTDISYIQELLGHASINTTLIYTHVTNHSLSKIQSPLDKWLNGIPPPTKNWGSDSEKPESFG